MASSSGLSTVEAGFGPIGASATVARLRHLATVLGLMPWRRARLCRLGELRWIAVRIACVVRALPWSTCPIRKGGKWHRKVHHYTLGLYNGNEPGPVDELGKVRDHIERKEPNTIVVIMVGCSNTISPITNPILAEYTHLFPRQCDEFYKWSEAVFNEAKYPEDL